MGQYNKALGEYQVSLRLSPDDVVNYSNLGLTYLSLGRLDEAKATFDQAVARKLDSESLHEDLYLFAFLRGDQAQMAEQVARGMSDPEDGLSTQSDTDAYHGRLHNARVLSRRAVESAIRTESKESAALWQVNAALREAEVGNTAFARQGVAAALALSQERFVKSVAALTLARVGDASGATALAKELQKSFPTNTLLNFYWLPTINAEIELRHENSSKAIVLLEPATPYELSMGGNESLLYAGYPAYVRGQAYLLAHNGTAAAAEFQKLLDHPGIMLNFETGALAHLQIGRAYFVAGDSAKAKTAYEDFFNLWKDADPDIPVLKDAKAEYARIQ